MTMMTLAERIQQLSPQQQARLWERLDKETSPTGAAPAVGDGSAQLVAYVVFRPGRSTPEAELKDFLRPSMLEFMVPNQFVFLDALPSTPNGKVDRDALPAPDTGPAPSPAAFVGPRSDTEVALVRIWADVLRVQNVGVHDDFFQLGGHSLLALQVMGRVRETFKADLPLRTLFDFPTVVGLAMAIDKAPRSGAAEPIKKIARGDTLEHARFSNPIS
jgi:acyl carrier protein